MDRASGVKERPAPRDFTICIRCGEVLQFGAELELVAAESDEFDALPEEKKEKICQLSTLIRLMNAGGAP